MLISCFWLFVTWSASLPPWLLWWNLNLEMDILLELVWKFYWEHVPSACQFMHQCNCFNGMVMKSSFLVDSFPMEPLNQGLIEKWKFGILLGWNVMVYLIFCYAFIWRMCFQILSLWYLIDRYHICFNVVQICLFVKMEIYTIWYFVGIIMHDRTFWMTLCYRTIKYLYIE